MELWQIAELFHDDENDDPNVPTRPPGPPTPMSGDALLLARVTAAREGRPPPEATPVSDAAVLGIMAEVTSASG